MSKDKKRFFGLVARGLGMGAADVVPGVSGGTIAFITGIYEELLETISGIKFSLLKTWKKEGFKAMWKELNGNFLLAIFLGIGISIVSFAKLLKYLLEHHEILLWSFFFGLIISSIWLVGKTVKKWSAINISGLLMGAIVAYVITVVSPSSGTSNLFYIFLCGTLAISAMILPGISGSFILLLLGVYTTILGAVSGIIDSLKDKNWEMLFDQGTIIAVFGVGCVFGLLAFSRLLNYLFKRNKDLIIAILTGFLVGSLNKIWPWKETTEWGINSHGEKIPLVQKNISPQTYADITGTDHQALFAILLAITSLLLVIGLEFFSKRNNKITEN
ncbi:DUF368 domain-containing protein [Paracrocinitomix mangrovi]|uniref:DUF368 domain-containing protein n=1 Tax=Paracrocinitomix mangrovi TaxID=2862509 RepID=UPI001C8E2695|nr:DUF368 domain-containing protein [Paracrocinitomix mangrovi]UKN03086.1 DUF368 domain-containing protein [Paracrocinitomix mangrovi]